jgi:hypothetical protein
MIFNSAASDDMSVDASGAWQQLYERIFIYYADVRRLSIETSYTIRFE